jgi:hypothetical protein
MSGIKTQVAKLSMPSVRPSGQTLKKPAPEPEKTEVIRGLNKTTE